MELLTNVTFDDFRGADNFPAGRDVAVLSELHEGCPGTSDEGAGTGARKRGRGVHTASPGSGNEVSVLPQLLRPENNDGVAFRRKSIFMGITRNGSDAFETEIKRRGGEAGTVKEGDKERSEAAVDMERDIVAERETGKGGDIVNNSVGEVGGGPNKENGIEVYKASDGACVDFESERINRYFMDFDPKVMTGLVEGGMCGDGDDPVKISIVTS